MTGTTGQFFKEFGITVAFAVFFSLLVARLITPMMAAFFLKGGHAERPPGALTKVYLKALGWAIRRPFIAAAMGLAVFVASLAPVVMGLVPMTFIPRLIAAGNGGYIVNTASMAGWLASGAPGIYNTTKFAVRGMSESLRYSLAPHGIGVSILCPGLVKSYIYASDDVRPKELLDGAKPVDTANVQRLAEFHEFGMDPDVIAARVLDGMRENRTYIFSHPEFKDEVTELFQEYLADFRDLPEDPGFEKRTGFETFRRERYAEARAAARKAT
jgi:NAD(P)-dependent dehydrogenase (short-subunit alcohol dehydrogenase family)